MNYTEIALDNDLKYVKRNAAYASGILCVIPANTVRNITFVKVPVSSFMYESNDDVISTYVVYAGFCGFHANN